MRLFAIDQFEEHKSNIDTHSVFQRKISISTNIVITITVPLKELKNSDIWGKNLRNQNSIQEDLRAD